MDESLDWLRAAAAAPALPGLITGLIKNLRLILIHPGLGNAGKITAITAELDAVAPPPPPPLPPAARTVAGQLASGASATALFSQIAGEPAAFTVWHTAAITLPPAHCALLGAPPGTRAVQRHAAFTARGAVIAEVSSDVITTRLPSAVIAGLGAGEPLGAVLAGTGRREPLSVIPHAGGIISSARIWLGSVPVALAREHVQPWAAQTAVPHA